jgi:hypothetical protein
MSREAFERHCPMPKALVFNASLNRYDGGVYTNALSYNDMWCAWQYAWQAALQHTQQSSPEGYVLVPKSALDGALYLAGLAVAHTDFGSQYRADFKVCCEALLSAGKGDDE